MEVMESGQRWNDGGHSENKFGQRARINSEQLRAVSRTCGQGSETLRRSTSHPARSERCQPNKSWWKAVP